MPTWRRAGKRFRQGRGVPPPVVYLVVGESRAGRCAGGGRSLNACAISMKSPLASAGHTCRRGGCMRSKLIQYLSKLNPKLNCQEPKLDSQLRVVLKARIKPSRLRRIIYWFLRQRVVREKRAPPVCCRGRATRSQVSSRSRPRCRRCAPLVRRPPTSLSLLWSPNWRPPELHTTSKTSRARK